MTEKLRIGIIKAKNLAKKDIFGASDPYVKVQLFKSSGRNGALKFVQSFQTAVIHRCLNPQWNEEVIFEVLPQVHVIVFEVFDSNRITRDDFLGRIEIVLKHCHIEAEGSHEIPPKDFILQPRSARSRVRGFLTLRLSYCNENANVAAGGGAQRGSANAEIAVAEDDEISPENVSCSSSDPGISFSSSWEMLNGGSAPEETNVESPESPLPEGWDERIAPDGRRYYVDHLSRRTQWHRPTTVGSGAALAPGWEERTDANGRMYYVDHANRRTQWERPTVMAAAEALLATASGGGGGGGSSTSSSTQIGAAPIANSNSSMSDEGGEVDALRRHFQGRRHISNEDTLCVLGTSVDNLNRLSIAENSSSTSVTPNTLDVNSSRHRIHGRTSVASTQGSTINLASPESASGVIGSEEEEALPAGWQMAVAANGRRFFINHNTRQTTWDDPRSRRSRSASMSPVSPDTAHSRHRRSSKDDLLKDLGPLPGNWEERVHSDGRTFYINHETRSTQWEDPRLEKLGGPAVPYSRDYKQKYDYFRSKLRTPRDIPNKIDIPVTRDRIFEDSFRVISAVRKADHLKARLWVEFNGERGLDYGGLAREWFFLLSREMFNPYYGLFEYSATDNYTLQINALSGLANPEHLKYFKFIGRVAGMAVYHGKLLDGFFIRPFYKMMLDRRIVLKDMESVDSEYYKSLEWILENDPQDLCLTFSVDEESFGKLNVVELIEGGQNIEVTNENKRQYIEHIIRWRFVSRVEQQMRAFKEGFNELIPRDAIKIFDAAEMELLLCGLQDIDVNDWKRNTLYKGEYNQNHPVVVNFWKAVYSLSAENRSRLLQFVTGTSRVPMNGFAELYGSNGPQKFTIECWGKPDQFPRAHTCFNRIDLPPYKDYNELRRRLLMAIENSADFGGVD